MVYDHLFYHADLTQPVVTLSSVESEHCCRALRHRNGDQVRLTDGQGTTAVATILVDSAKACMLEIVDLKKDDDNRSRRLHLVIAPTKNMDRMEWLVEKCVEIGVGAITFILCDNSERPRVNMERLQRIAVSALKQSQTSWLPPMQLITFQAFMDSQKATDAHKFIAWCDHQNTRQLADEPLQNNAIILLIGPEGDFSSEEIQTARKYGYQDVKLGNRRLRTETAGLYGCMLVASKSL